MTIVYTMRLPVRRYEVNQFGLVHDHVYQQYLEEAAIQASAAAGFGPRWYDKQGTVWVIRELTIEYLWPADMNDELEIHTWVADFRRVRSHREYEIYRLPDRRLLVRASADWVYINRQTLWPTRIPEEAIALLPATGTYAVPPARPVPPLPTAMAGREFRCQRTVQRHEIDGMGHANNAVYVTWFEQAVADALAAWLPTMQQVWPCWRRHHIEYRSAILPGENVEIVTYPVGLGQARSAWRQEVRRMGSIEPAIADESIVLCYDPEKRRLRPWPRERGRWL